MKSVAAYLSIVLIVAAGCQSTGKPAAPQPSTISPLTIAEPGEVSPDQQNVGMDVQQVVATQSVDFGEAESPIEEYVALGLANNPLVCEARNRVSAAQCRIVQAESLPDPMVNTTTHLAPVETAAGRQQFALGISQKYIPSVKRATKASIARDEVAAARANLSQVELDVSEQIRVACYQLIQVREVIEITQDDASSLEQIFEVVARRYEVDQSVSQQDWLNIQVEQSRVANQLTDLEQKEAAYRHRLARLLRLPLSSPLAIVSPQDELDSQLDVESLISIAESLEPGLQKQLAKWRQAKKQTELAQLENLPDLTFGLNWIATSSAGISPVANGDDALMLAIGFNLPVWQDRIRGSIGESRANRAAEACRYQGMKDEVAEDVFTLVTKIESTRQILELLRTDIIPKANQTLGLSIDQYSTGETDYLQLIDNWRALLRYRIAESQLLSDHRQTVAALSRRVGVVD